MRSMAVRPRIFSRLRCWAGRELVVEDHGVGVDRAATARAAPAPCPGRRRWPGRDGRAAGRPGRPRRRRPCRPAAPARRGWPRPPRRRPGEHHPDQHDPLPERPVDQGVGQRRRHASVPDPDERRSTTTSATRRTGPARTAGSPSVSAEPHLQGPARVVHRHAVADQAPAAGGGGGGAAPGAAGQVSPTPRSHTRRVSSSADRARGDELDVDAAGMPGLEAGADSATASSAGSSGPKQHQVGVADVDLGGPGGRRTVVRWLVARGAPAPCRRWPSPVPARSPGR